MVKGAIFDMDGTILDSMLIWYNTAEIYLNNIGIKAESDLGKIMFSMSLAEGAEFLKERYCLNFDTDEIIAGVNRTVEDFYCYKVQLKEGVEQFLNGMKQAGFKMVVATLTDRHLAERALERLNVLRYFDRIFTGTEIGAGKHKPDIYLAAAEFMGTIPEETWVFEDALYAIKTAKRAGFKTVGVYDEFSRDDFDEIKKAADIYLIKLDNVDVFLGKAALK